MFPFAVLKRMVDVAFDVRNHYSLFVMYEDSPDPTDLIKICEDRGFDLVLEYDKIVTEDVPDLDEEDYTIIPQHHKDLMSSRDLGRNDRVSAPAATKLYYEPNCRWEVEGFEYDGDLRSKVVGSLLYGAEIFGWKEREKMEVIQNKYIKWCLRLERSTPEYIVLEETKRE